MQPPSLERIIISGARILYDHQWLEDSALIIEHGKISGIIATAMLSHHLPAKQFVFDKDYLLTPGLIDLHIHGIAGQDVMDADIKALQIMQYSLPQYGVTSFLATTMTVANARLKSALAVIAECMQQFPNGAEILGVHLEGPYIASQQQGAQVAEFSQLPNEHQFLEWQSCANHAIKLVTLAPELPNALAFIEKLVEWNIIPAIGHTAATYEETQKAIQAGARYATHLFNAMSPIHHRAPGASGALLLSDQVVAELIVDHHHLHAGTIALASRVKGNDRLILVSDAIRATCMPDGQYELGGQSVQVNQGKATLADGRLAGSTLTLSQAVKNMAATEYVGLTEAIAMATSQPAMTLGVSRNKGRIEVGYDADVVVFTPDLTVALTLCRGQVAFNPASI